MRVGITFDLKTDLPLAAHVPDDVQEEFDSLATVEGVAHVLRNLGHEVELLGDGRELLTRLLDDPPDFVFNFAEGQGVSRSREARVPALLEMLGIPHTGSDPLTLAATLDKDCARRLVASHGEAVPQGEVIDPRKVDPEEIRSRESLPYPVIVKPAWEGSSKGIRGKCVVDTPAELADALEARRDQQQPLLVEEYIEGDELTVGMVGNDPPRIIGVMRVTPVSATERFVYSLEVKRDYLRQVHYQAPPYLPARVLTRIEKSALRVFEVLGCRDVARIDFRLRDGIPYFIEVNPLPGLNAESSDLVILAKLRGWSYEQLIESIFQAGVQRAGLALVAR